MSQQIHPLADALNAELQTNNTTLFSLLSQRGKRIYFPARGILGQGAEAKECAINATIGTAFEDDGSPLCLECLEEMVKLPSAAYLYAPSFGLPGLRSVWREMLLEKNPTLKGKEFSLPVVTHALTHGLSVTGYLFMEAGDTIAVPDLYWDNYELLFEESCGAKLQTFPMFSEGAFNVRGMETLLQAPGAKKIVILNFPNNPTGYTATERDAAAIRDTLWRVAESGKQVLVVLDDAYFGLVYEDGVSRESLFVELANLHEKLLAVKLDGPTKEDYVWGMRVGFLTFGTKGATPLQYKALESKAAGVVRGSISSATNVGQAMLLDAYKNCDYTRQKEEKYNTLKRRYDRIKTLFAEHPEYADSFVPMPFNSGYFMCVKPLGVAAEAVRKRLISNYNTGVIVLMGLIRLAYSSVPYNQLETLFANLDRAIRELKAQPHEPGAPT